MLSLSKKTDYALIALAYLADRTDRTISAREIAAAHNLPLPLLMNILKSLHQAKILASTRGIKGGYRIIIDPHRFSLHDLVLHVDGQIQLIDCANRTPNSDCEDGCCRIIGECPVQAPLQALHHRLVRFLKAVKLSDLILPGHRIDVPLEAVGVS
jgi:Rrf2 family protein